PRPALDDEFLPVMRRWRRAVPTSPGGTRRLPIVVPLTHGLGEPRGAAPRSVFEACGEDISSLWTPVVLDQATVRITQPEAAEVASSILNAVLEARLQPQDEGLELALTTRGTGQPSAFVSVDATRLLGGASSQPGTHEDWERVLNAFRDVQGALSRSTRSRQLRVIPRAHLSACLAFGRVFNQAAGWQLTVVGRHGDTTMPTGSGRTSAPIESTLDPVGGPGPMTVEMDLISGNVSDLATNAIRESGEVPVARLQFQRTDTSDLRPDQVAAAADMVSVAIRSHVAELRPKLIRIFCAAPAEFAVLVGSRLTSLHADLQLYERDGDRYVASAFIPASVG
ncbi:MAG TPA: SAVED domain-containing protein, partial [Acidimicrobiales bacterium]|nr:SAVED domain-containing protein [Acidimicrobiales bacterium]